MSREATDGRRDRWRMVCDNPDCDTASAVETHTSNLPLARFRNEGWFIAQVWGDLCPKCLESGVNLGMPRMPDSYFSHPLQSQGEDLWPHTGLPRYNRTGAVDGMTSGP